MSSQKPFQSVVHRRSKQSQAMYEKTKVSMHATHTSNPMFMMQRKVYDRHKIYSYSNNWNKQRQIQHNNRTTRRQQETGSTTVSRSALVRIYCTQDRSCTLKVEKPPIEHFVNYGNWRNNFTNEFCSVPCGTFWSKYDRYHQHDVVPKMNKARRKSIWLYLRNKLKLQIINITSFKQDQKTTDRSSGLFML